LVAAISHSLYRLGYGLDDRDSVPGKGSDGSYSLRSFVQTDLDSIQPPVQWVKWPQREADNSPPSSAEVRMRGAVPPLPNISSWRDN